MTGLCEHQCHCQELARRAAVRAGDREAALAQQSLRRPACCVPPARTLWRALTCAPSPAQDHHANAPVTTLRDCLEFVSDRQPIPVDEVRVCA